MMKSVSEGKFNLQPVFFEQLHFLELEMEKPNPSPANLSKLVELYAVTIILKFRRPLNISIPRRTPDTAFICKNSRNFGKERMLYRLLMPLLSTARFIRRRKMSILMFLVGRRTRRLRAFLGKPLLLLKKEDRLYKGKSRPKGKD